MSKPMANKDVRDYLHRYWIEFNPEDISENKTIGYGVTAFDYADALQLLNEKIFTGGLPTVTALIEDADVETLGLEAVGRVERRGIWYPA